MSNSNSTPMELSEKMKALEAARLQIEKQFGQGEIMKLGDKADVTGIEVIPSGSILLDEALGIGGYPKGRIIEMYGPESSGKTTLALHASAEANNMQIDSKRFFMLSNFVVVSIKANMSGLMPISHSPL